MAVPTALGATFTTISVADWQATALVRKAFEQHLAPLACASDPDLAFVH